MPQSTPSPLHRVTIILWFVLFTIAPLNASDIDAIIDQRQALDGSIWEQEKLAQRYETAFINLWDEMRRHEDQSVALIQFPFDRFELPSFTHAQSYQDGIESFVPASDTVKPLSQSDFRQLVETYQRQGFRIEQSEWHHASFNAQENEAPTSTFTFALHVSGPNSNPQRYILKGTLAIAWQDAPENEISYPNSIRIQKMEILTRNNTPISKPTKWLESKPNTTPYGIVLVEDLNQDGLPDIAFPRKNALYLNKGNFQFQETQLAKFMIRGLPTAAFFADLNLDGKIEYVLSTADAPYLFAYTFNKATNSFDGKPFGIWKSDTPLKTGLLAAGDITGDGYPEIYLGQSAPIYENGKIPTPYFDANDGRPAFLLKNNRNLLFEDITEKSSIAQKRGRRAFTASFQDLNHDQRIDLLVTSDFSGVDVHENQNGALIDKTSEYLDDRSLFGMSHAFADFDRDGATDLLAVGMSSTTARRLEQMGLGRDEFPEHQKMRMRIAKGNRLYYGDPKGHLAQRETSENVARSGWSWGSSSKDFNNDSYPDIFIANGYLSKSTARDYCTNFWTHDIYSESAFSSEQLDSFYTQFGPEALVGGNQMGWNPFEKDHFYLNLEGKGFLNVAYLYGLSHGGDGRAVIGEDFDRDGRVDLLLIELDSIQSLERVHLYHNQLKNTGNWIGVTLRPTPGKPILGTRVVIECPDYTSERLYTHGEVFSGQNASNLNFGLGSNVTINQLRIHWPDGETTSIKSPTINQYLTVDQTQ
ncbi:FG-GAP repeat domain protein [Verrucomicrobiia bacterium DG1235]|nr:FG-GAP repeat domain protein [Verrucomicrobiae bacterium DG1235]